MTHSVAATSNAATASEPNRLQAAPASGTSFAEVQAAAVKDDKGKDKDKTKSTDAKDTSTSAPKAERTQKVEGHGYVEIVAGPRNGMFINNTGEARDGKAFLIVKRHGREFHVYGSGEERKVYEVGRKRETGDSGTTGTTGAGTTGAGTTGTGAAGTTGTGTAGTTGASGAATTPASGTATTT